jgi:hypothetical protein
MTPEERKDIEELLAFNRVGSPAVVAWLTRQLAHADWDADIERMGGGKKARNAFMKPAFDAPCAVSAFDMHAQLTADGRERGLWLWLVDESKARAETYDAWATETLDAFCKNAGVDSETEAKFRLSFAMDAFKHLARNKVNEAALLEWRAVRRLYAAIGKALVTHAVAMTKGTTKARTPRKPDRRGPPRRRDDKRKASLTTARKPHAVP